MLFNLSLMEIDSLNGGFIVAHCFSQESKGPYQRLNLEVSRTCLLGVSSFKFEAHLLRILKES
jgi:hypothetical protein